MLQIYRLGKDAWQNSHRERRWSQLEPESNQENARVGQKEQGCVSRNPRPRLPEKLDGENSKQENSRLPKPQSARCERRKRQAKRKWRRRCWKWRQWKSHCRLRSEKRWSWHIGGVPRGIVSHRQFWPWWCWWPRKCEQSHAGSWWKEICRNEWRGAEKGI